MYPVAIAKVVQTMGGGRVLGASPGSVGELAEAVAKGLPREVANEVAAHATTDRDMQKRLRNLVVPPASYKRSPVLSPSSSQKAERLARITALAQTAFGDAQEAQAWLTHPHALFGDRAPIEVSITELGARQVERVLLNIQYDLPV